MNLSSRSGRIHPAVWIIIIAIFGGVFYLLSPGSGVNASKRRPMTVALQGKIINMALFQYAKDNGGDYPPGESSTEVFQTLLDEDYLNNPAVFYIPMRGKVKPARDAKLKPENVSWDFTGGLDDKSDWNVPVVFMTGYRITYDSGAAAVPLIKPFPSFAEQSVPLTRLDQMLNRWPLEWHTDGRLAVGYRSQTVRLAMPVGATVPNFVPQAFHPDDHTYVQLTPTGPLNP